MLIFILFEKFVLNKVINLVRTTKARNQFSCLFCPHVKTAVLDFFITIAIKIWYPEAQFHQRASAQRLFSSKCRPISYYTKT